MMKTPTRTVQGLLLGLGSGTSFALSSLVTKQLYATGVTAWVYTALTSVAALVILLPFWRGGGRWREILPAGVAGAFSILLYNVALARMDLSVTVVFAYTFPAFALLLDRLFRQRTPTRFQALSAALILLGVALVAGGPGRLTGHIDPIGALAATVAALAHAAYGFFGERLSERQGVQAVVLNSLLSLLLSAVVAPAGVIAGFALPLSVWGWFLLTAIIGRILPLWFFTTGSRLAGAGPVSLTATAELPFSLLIGLLFLGEVMSPLQWGGAFMVVAAIWLSAVPERTAGSPA